MPLFSRSEPVKEEVVTTTPAPEHQRTGLFGRKRSISPTPSNRTNLTSSTHHTAHTAHSRGHGGGLFRRNSAASSATTTTTASAATAPSHRRSLLHRTFGNGNDDGSMDPSIMNARERVMSAENAEREADRMLDIARREVRDARDHVRRLEVEAKEEARRAKIKQFHAREVSKRAKPLGRFGDI